MNTFCAKIKDENLWPILPNCLNYFFFASTIVGSICFKNIWEHLHNAKGSKNNEFMNALLK